MKVRKRIGLSNMFTSSVFTKSRDDKGKNLLSDSIFDDVTAEFAPDEADREKRRKGNTNMFKKIAPISLISSVKSENMCVNDVDLKFRNETSTDASKTCESLHSILGKGNVSGEDKLDIAVDMGAVMNDNIAVGMDDSSTNRIVVEESLLNDIEVKREVQVKKDNVLNAKVSNAEKEQAYSATTGWQAVRAELNHTLRFEIESDGALPFYLLDAHEEFYGANAGNLYLFGKVKVGNSYQSCCIVLKNMQRCLYAIPSGSIFQNDTVTKLEKDVEESNISSTTFRSKLQEMASGMKTDIAKRLLEQNVSSFSMTPVKRNYAFERSDIPLGENYILKINYPFKDPPLPSDLKGETFSALLGTHSSALELFLIKRKIKGPSWLTASKFSICPVPQRVSWCKFEFVVDFPKNIQVSNS